ncbi:type II toxin-antitoxin system YafQ family toxin [Agathobaculum desmolans]|uniref:type II toxin-antitoxin system YafQ family toxin n=1 Tax=Agathobaculum desmolans TaxID=39484 RepID=UPI0004E0D91D|nr:type II toxin-antitoxin system YafQ family toxin [Agathobaculum desmolans]
MRELYLHTSFKRDYKRIKKRHYPLNELETVIELLRQDEPLPAQYRDHALTGDYAGLRECHIRPDWLLIYRLHDNQLILALTRTGTHADLFDL